MDEYQGLSYLTLSTFDELNFAVLSRALRFLDPRDASNDSLPVTNNDIKIDDQSTFDLNDQKNVDVQAVQAIYNGEFLSYF